MIYHKKNKERAQKQNISFHLDSLDSGEFWIENYDI